MTLDIKQIRDSFAAARPHAMQIVERFYQHLWHDHPASQTLFAKTDMEKQKSALASSLGYIVDHLDQPEKLLRYLKSMGSRHVRYGTQPEHYAMVGSTLLKTFAEAFGKDWTPALAEQWTLAYQFIAETMQEGARTEPLPSPKSKPALAPDSALRIELPTDVRLEIRRAVQEAFRKAVQEEIQACIHEELQDLTQSKVVELYKKSA
jgi:hemoglobin-like flavoprotein